MHKQIPSICIIAETMKLSQARAIVQRLALCRDSSDEDCTGIKFMLYQAATQATRAGATRIDRENLAYTLENVVPETLEPEALALVEELRHG